MFVWLVNAFDASYIAHYSSHGYAPLTSHIIAQIDLTRGKREMCSFGFMQNSFRILKPIQKSSKCVWVFRNTGANAFAKNQMRLAYEDKRDLYCTLVHYMRTPNYLQLDTCIIVRNTLWNIQWFKCHYCVRFAKYMVSWYHNW